MGTVTFRLIRSIVEPLVAGKAFSGVSSKYDGTLESMRGESLLAFTGAKLYYLGGGWWRIGWYASDRSDLNKLKLAML